MAKVTFEDRTGQFPAQGYMVPSLSVGVIIYSFNNPYYSGRIDRRGDALHFFHKYGTVRLI